MQITEVRVVQRSANGGKVRARVTVTFDDQFVVHGLRVVEGANGLFVSMPGVRTESGEYRDLAHPITSELRNEIQTAVLQAYFAEV